MTISSSFKSKRRRTELLLAACALACLLFAYRGGAADASPSANTAAAAQSGQTSGQGEGTQPRTNPVATLEECLTVGAQTERAATFEGEMAAIPGTARMEIRVNVLEKLPQEPAFRTVIAPGLGVWRHSAPGIKTYTDLKQVTNLAAPAVYRGAVEFRWLNDKGHIIKSVELFTNRCKQPSLSQTETAPEGGEPTTTAPTETTGKTGAGTSSSGS